jgi:hypothetical protein
MAREPFVWSTQGSDFAQRSRVIEFLIAPHIGGEPVIIGPAIEIAHAIAEAAPDPVPPVTPIQAVAGAVISRSSFL